MIIIMKKKKPIQLNNTYIFSYFSTIQTIKSYMINHTKYIDIVLNYRYTSSWCIQHVNDFSKCIKQIECSIEQHDYWVNHEQRGLHVHLNKTW